jgi:glycosyltransferase involved in cell wall biosynthesis
MRILHVAHEFPPYEFAGTAIYTFNIVRAQAEKHDVFVFARHSDEKRAEHEVFDEDRETYQVRFMNRPNLDWSSLDKTYTDPKAEAIFCAYLDEVKPDLVHFQHILGLSHTVLAEVKKRGIALVMTLHDFWAMCPMGQRMCYTDKTLCDEIDYAKCGPCCYGENWSWSEAEDKRGEAEGQAEPKGKPSFQDLFQHRYRYTPGRTGRKPRAALWAAGQVALGLLGGGESLPEPEVLSNNPFAVRTRAMQAALAQADLLITPSAFLRDEFVRVFGVPKQKIIHSPNGMKFDHVTQHPREKADVIRFGFMGSIIPTKGVHVLAEAAKKLKDLGGFRVEIYGAPNQWTVDYEKECHQIAEGLDFVEFKGRFDNKKVGEVLAKMDVLVVPSIWYENAPLTLNEAAMTKTPVLASDRGGMLEFVRDNGYGRNFKLGDADDLAAKMRAIVEDPSQIPTLAGREVYIKPVADNAVELAEIYARLVRGEPHGAEDYVYGD